MLDQIYDVFKEEALLPLFLFAAIGVKRWCITVVVGRSF